MKTQHDNHLCAVCGDKRAIFFVRGGRTVHRDDEHDLCPRCYRDARNAERARVMADRVKVIAFPASRPAEERRVTGAERALG